MRKAVGLKTQLSKLTVKNDLKSGCIRLNTLSLDDQAEWSGRYHSDYELTLTAQPKRGHSFSHWEITGAQLTSGATDSQQINIRLQGNATIKAVYTSAPKGDVNADGAFSVADAVMLQKWLLGDTNTLLSDWKAGDLYEDDRLDVFDLCMIRTHLISD